MKRRTSDMRWVRTVAILTMTGLVGCGGEEEDHIKLVRVSGTITKNGKPMPNAEVSFVPQSGNKDSTPGVDKTGPDGNYLVKFKGRTGVAPGKYKVFVSPAFEVGGEGKGERFKEDPIMFKIMQEARGTDKKGAAAAKKAGEKSEFDAEVPEGTSATLDFDVKSS